MLSSSQVFAHPHVFVDQVTAEKSYRPFLTTTNKIKIIFATNPKILNMMIFKQEFVMDCLN